MASGNVKGITIEFRGETGPLDSALKNINSEVKSLDKELKLVNNALKFNPTNIDLWKQKQTLLNQKVNDTRDKLKLLKEEQKRMDAEGVDKNSEEYRKLQREIIETESKAKTFEGQLKKIGNVKLRAVSEQFKQMGDKLTEAGNAMKGVSLAGAAVTGALGAMTVMAADNADELNTLSKVYGISTQELQKYKAAADLVDVPMETIAASQVKLTRSMSSASTGSEKQAEAFKKLGVSITNADGSLRSSDEVFNDVIKALGGVENETERNALAMTLMGKSAMELNPLIEDGGEAYTKLAEAMANNNLQFVDQDTLDKANQFNETLDTLKAEGLATVQTLGTQLAAYLAPAMEKIADALGKVLGWLSQLSPQTLTIIGIIAAVVAAIAPVLLFLGKIAFAISSIMSLMATVGPVIAGLAGPIGIAIAAIAAIIAIGVLLYKNWDKIKAAAAALLAKISSAFTAIKTAISNALMDALRVVMDVWNNIKAKIAMAITNIKTAVSTGFENIKTKISTTFEAIKTKVKNTWDKIKESITKPIEKAKEAVKSAIDKIKSIINGAHLKLPHFKLPHFKIGKGELPWGIGGKGKAPSISVDWYAKGGIFNGASLIGVGEKGPEAVIPLDKLWTKMDKIADASGGNNTQINIYAPEGMDVRALADEVERRLINKTNRRRLAW